MTKPGPLPCSPLSFRGGASAFEEADALILQRSPKGRSFRVPALRPPVCVSVVGRGGKLPFLRGEKSPLSLAVAPTPGRSQLRQPSAQQMDSGADGMKMFM